MGAYGSKDQHPNLLNNDSENEYLKSIEWIYCEKCGHKHLKQYKSCPNCGKAHKKKSKWAVFWSIVAIIEAISIVYFFRDNIIEQINLLKHYSPTQTYTKSSDYSYLNDTESSSEYKSKCEYVDYEVLARNPNKYAGKYLKETGKVIQVMDITGGVMIRMNVTEDEYGFWNDTVVVVLVLEKNDDRILEDDIITIYGKCYGLYTYETVLGTNISLPRIDARYYEFK